MVAPYFTKLRRFQSRLRRSRTIDPNSARQLVTQHPPGYRAIWAGLSLFLLFLIACAGTTTGTPTTTPTSPATVEATPSDIATPSPSPTLGPTTTIQPPSSPTPSDTLTPTPVATPTVVPTIEPPATSMPTLGPTPTTIIVPIPSSTPAATPVPQTLELSLLVFSPEDNIVVEESQLEVTGRASPDATVSINGQVADMEDSGEFSASVSLMEGPNLLEVIASDLAGNLLFEVLTVVYIP